MTTSESSAIPPEGTAEPTPQEHRSEPAAVPPPPAHLCQYIIDAFSEYAVFILDGEGRITYADRSAEVMYGHSRAEMIGRLGTEILEIPALASTERLEDLLGGSVESGKLEFDLPQKRKSGEVFPARVRFHPGAKENGATVVLVTELEPQSGVEQLKRDFLTLVSHELRTPLTSIKGAASMLRSGGLGKPSPEQQQFLSIIERNCDRLNHLIASLLDMTRLEADRLWLHCESVNVDKMVREVGRLVSEQYAAKQIRLEHAECPEPARVQADPLRLEQIFLSLLENAFKFTPNGGSVRTAVTLSNEEVCIEVADTGVGIPAEEQGRIFEKFYQVDSSLTRIAGGAGLGLYLARKLVRMHHGRIWVRSAPGIGTAVFVALPRNL